MLKNPFQTKDTDTRSEEEKFPNWYLDRYDSISAQRNVLFLLTLLSLVCAGIGIFAVSYISTSKSFQPFVVQIEEGTGATKVVDPLSSDILSGNQALAQYFIKEYLIARETYNPVDYQRNVTKVVRLFSSDSVYKQFVGYISQPGNNPEERYKKDNTTYLRIRSWSTLDGNSKKYMVRFTIQETAGAMQRYNKIATIEYDYVPMQLTNQDRDINPVGFQVQGYGVNDDNS